MRLSVAKQADLISWRPQLSAVAEHDESARVRKGPRASKHWARLCGFIYGVGQKVADMTVCCACLSHGIDNVIDWRDIFERKAMVAEHVQKEEDDLDL